MSGRTRANALAKRLDKLRGSRSHSFRARSGVVLQLRDDVVLASFFGLMGGGPSGLSERARAHLATVNEGLMADVTANLIQHARGDLLAAPEPQEEDTDD